MGSSLLGHFLQLAETFEFREPSGISSTSKLVKERTSDDRISDLVHFLPKVCDAQWRNFRFPERKLLLLFPSPLASQFVEGLRNPPSRSPSICVFPCNWVQNPSYATVSVSISGDQSWVGKPRSTPRCKGSAQREMTTFCRV